MIELTLQITEKRDLDALGTVTTVEHVLQSVEASQVSHKLGAAMLRAAANELDPPPPPQKAHRPTRSLED